MLNSVSYDYFTPFDQFCYKTNLQYPHINVESNRQKISFITKSSLTKKSYTTAAIRSYSPTLKTSTQFIYWAILDLSSIKQALMKNRLYFKIHLLTCPCLFTTFFSCDLSVQHFLLYHQKLLNKVKLNMP